MSPSRRRRRRIRDGGGETQAATPARPSAPALPEWRWRTLPVFAALSFGLFVGIVLGGTPVVAGGGIVGTVVFLIVAGMLGLSVSRLLTRGLMRRGFIKPRVRRR